MRKKIITNLLHYALDSEADNLALENESQHISLTYSLPDGESRSFKLPKKLEKGLSENIRQILNLAPDELVNNKYCKFNNKNKQINFWLTITPTKNGERIVIKIVSKKNKLLRLNQLGFARPQLLTIKDILKKKTGLILVSSPDNQGKSTTLKALVQEIDKPSLSLYFISNKFEQDFYNVNSLADNKNNWDKVLSIDSEVIIAEIESTGGLQNAILAANSGRLVLATLKADSVWEVLDKYLKIKLPLKLKLKGLKLIINQRIHPLKRDLSKKTSLLKEHRQEIALFEFLETGPALKNFLISTSSEKNKKNFWHDLRKLAHDNNYQSLISDQQNKKKDGLIK